MHNILLIPFFCLILKCVVYGQKQGDACQQDDGLTGKCELISNCNSALSSLKNGIRPKTCGFQGMTPVVCCIEHLHRLNKSEEKCIEYSQMALQSRFKIDIKSISISAFGGELSVGREFPHMAALGFGERESPKWMCGGSLISDQYVLTAAHCLWSRELGNVQWVRLGDLNLYNSRDDAKPQDFQIIERIKHPDYVPPSRYNDIALLKLDRKVEYNRYVYPACLHRDFAIGSETLTATGWGLTKAYGDPSEHLIKVELDLFSDESCRATYGPDRTLKQGVLSESQVCAGSKYTEKGTCTGDSGGPIQIRTGDSRFIFDIVGITSFGRGSCGYADSGVYTRVSHYVPWIETIVWP